MTRIRLHLFVLSSPALLIAGDNNAALRLGQGINAYSQRDYQTVVQQLRGVPAQLPKVSDYAVYYLASSELQTGDIDGAVRDLRAYRAQPATPSSPLAGKISLLT